MQFVISHDSALALYELSDVMPAEIHLIMHILCLHDSLHRRIPGQLPSDAWRRKLLSNIQR